MANALKKVGTVNDDGVIISQGEGETKVENTYSSSGQGINNFEDPNKFTGSGLDAAKGTEYSYKKQADEKANMLFDSDVLTARQQAMAKKQSNEVQSADYQKQFAMANYDDQQSIEKAGWTGGYVLDTKRQSDYLKTTVQAQFYNQQEMERKGYDTQLSAARLAYDTNNFDLANEYYEKAVEQAVTESQLTGGRYYSPEVRDMLGQYNIAVEKLEENPEDQQAISVIESVNTWFKSNGISSAGVKTLAQEDREDDAALTLDALLDSLDLGSYEGIEYNSDGSVAKTSDGQIKTVDFSSMSTEDKVKYIGTHNSSKDRYYGYLHQLAGEASTNFVKWVYNNKGTAFATKTIEGDVTKYALVSDQASELFKEYLKVGEGKKIISEIGSILEKNPDMLEDFSDSVDYNGDEIYNITRDSVEDIGSYEVININPNGGPYIPKKYSEAILTNPVAYQAALEEEGYKGVELNKKLKDQDTYLKVSNGDVDNISDQDLASLYSNFTNGNTQFDVTKKLTEQINSYLNTSGGFEGSVKANISIGKSTTPFSEFHTMAVSFIIPREILSETIATTLTDKTSLYGINRFPADNNSIKIISSWSKIKQLLNDLKPTAE